MWRYATTAARQWNAAPSPARNRSFVVVVRRSHCNLSKPVSNRAKSKGIVFDHVGMELCPVQTGESPASTQLPGRLWTKDRQTETPGSAAGSAGSAEWAGANQPEPVDSRYRCRWRYR